MLLGRVARDTVVNNPQPYEAQKRSAYQIGNTAM